MGSSYVGGEAGSRGWRPFLALACPALPEAPPAPDHAGRGDDGSSSPDQPRSPPGGGRLLRYRGFLGENGWGWRSALLRGGFLYDVLLGGPSVGGSFLARDWLLD